MTVPRSARSPIVVDPGNLRASRDNAKNLHDGVGFSVCVYVRVAIFIRTIRETAHEDLQGVLGDGVLFVVGYNVEDVVRMEWSDDEIYFRLVVFSKFEKYSFCCVFM